MINFFVRLLKLLGRMAAIAALLLAGFFGLDTFLPDKDVFIQPYPNEYTTEDAVNRVPQSTKKKSTLTLGSKNTLVFREVFTAASVASLQYELLQMSMRIGPNKPIYLVLDTPGGSVSAGQDLIQFINALPNRVTTVTLFAASMGFMTVQNVKGPRLIADQGVLMSHRARLGLRGEVPGEFLVRLNWIMRSLTKLEKRAADRIKMGLKEYRHLIRDEYWVEGPDALKDKMVDRVTAIRCGKSMMGTTESTVRTIFGPVKVTFSKCPLIRYPVKIDFSQTVFRSKESRTAAQFVELRSFVKTMFFDKRDFVTKYIITSEYEKFVQ